MFRKFIIISPKYIKAINIENRLNLVHIHQVSKKLKTIKMNNKCSFILNNNNHHKNILILLKNILHTTNKNLL